MDWKKLDKNQSANILRHIATVSDPYLFAENSSEASFKPLSFYQDHMVYRITNYATLPAFSLTFLSDGESFHLLDGSPSPLNIVNAKGSLYLSEANVIDYVDFYLGNIRSEDGDIYLLRDLERLPFIDSLATDQQMALKQKHEMPTVTLDNTTSQFVVIADLYYGGTLLKSAIYIDNNGQLDIQPRNMIMTSTDSPVQFRSDS